MNPDDIAREKSAWCRRWWRACGKVSTRVRVRELRDQVLQWRSILREGGQIEISKGPPLPSPPPLALTILPPSRPHHHSLALTIPHQPGTAPLPWRLSHDAVLFIDDRVNRIVYPHGISGCSKDGVGKSPICHSPISFTHTLIHSHNRFLPQHEPSVALSRQADCIFGDSSHRSAGLRPRGKGRSAETNLGS